MSRDQDGREYATPLRPALELMSQKEMERRIEYVRAHEPDTAQQTFATPITTRPVWSLAIGPVPGWAGPATLLHRDARGRWQRSA